MKNIEILYEDDFSIIVNKPAGLAVQGGKDVKTSLDRLLAEIRTPAPLLVHRLDKDTSGVLLAAKNRESAASFSKIFEGGKTNRKAVKIYIAVCKGQPAQNEGVIKEELQIRGDMKKSETRFKVLKIGKIEQADDAEAACTAKAECDYSVLEIELGTGRMHQIRRHLAMTGNPILGDDKYGDFALNKKLHKTLKLKKLMLHASRLIIKEKYNIDVCAPLPEYFSLFMG
ncbi:MAG: RluA family pseudouridine synthase [Treponema sp.]|nr:RluA family pseudouridine synthase [Treponema sp.]MCL2251869.1 RluA family pseudouridine synthase [Treponema sp.]